MNTDKNRKRNPQGRRWRRLDNTGKVFPLIANENLSNVFRVSVILKEDIDPVVLQKALELILPRFEGFQVKLKKGFFWYYLEHNKRTPLVEQETTYPCKFIDPKSNQLFLFRVSYYEKKINLEVFHAITDGMGAVSFLRALTYRYLDLKHECEARSEQVASPAQTDVEDSYLTNYKALPKRRYSFEKAFQLRGDVLSQGAEHILHGKAGLKELKAVCKAHGVSVTKYLVACLIWAIHTEYRGENNKQEIIDIPLPINLRTFFGSKTISNFFAVVGIQFDPKRGVETFEEILGTVSQQMDEKISKEKMEEIISYNVSREKKWYVRIIPLFFKWLALRAVFKRNDKAHTVTLSNVGPIQVDDAYRNQIETFLLTIGVSKRQNAKCSVCAFGDHVTITFATVFGDSRLQNRFFNKLRQDGIPIEAVSNGIGDPAVMKGMYPNIEYDPGKWKTMLRLFYGTLFAATLLSGIINILTFSGSWWSGIAIPGILYGAMTVRYSISKHANLGRSVLVQTIGLQILLIMIDIVKGYQGWSVNFAIPLSILFADIVVVFLILINRLNWQSYFMYQIAITVFSFIPMLLWCFGWITRPATSVVSMFISIVILILTIWKGNKRVKSELTRRFHM